MTPCHPQLSEGFLEMAMNGKDMGFAPVFQVLAVKRMPSSSSISEDRFRLILSDGQTYNSFVILTTFFNYLVESNILTEYSILKIKRFATSKVMTNDGQTKQVMVILDADVLVPGKEVNKVLGNADVSFIEERLQSVDITN